MAGYIMKEQAELIVESALREYIRTGAVETAFEKLYSLPDADVAPVVHAHWITAEDDDFWTCSNCGKFIHKNCAQGYCPKCGARMGGRRLRWHQLQFCFQ